MSTYNGWTNYQTWRVNLELFDGMTLEDLGLTVHTSTDLDQLTIDLADILESTAHEIVEGQATGWALDIAQSFLQDVDWQEIAQHMVSDAQNG